MLRVVCVTQAGDRLCNEPTEMKGHKMPCALPDLSSLQGPYSDLRREIVRLTSPPNVDAKTARQLEFEVFYPAGCRTEGALKTASTCLPSLPSFSDACMVLQSAWMLPLKYNKFKEKIVEQCQLSRPK